MLGKRSRASQESMPPAKGATVSCEANKRLKIGSPSGEVHGGGQENIKPVTEMIKAKPEEPDSPAGVQTMADPLSALNCAPNSM